MIIKLNTNLIPRFKYMRKKIYYKKNEVQLKKKLIKPVNQSNLDYLSKLANHVNVIER